MITADLNRLALVRLRDALMLPYHMDKGIKNALGHLLERLKPLEELGYVVSPKAPVKTLLRAPAHFSEFWISIPNTSLHILAFHNLSQSGFNHEWGMILHLLGEGCSKDHTARIKRLAVQVEDLNKSIAVGADAPILKGMLNLSQKEWPHRTRTDILLALLWLYTQDATKGLSGYKGPLYKHPDFAESPGYLVLYTRRSFEYMLENGWIDSLDSKGDDTHLTDEGLAYITPLVDLYHSNGLATTRASDRENFLEMLRTIWMCRKHARSAPGLLTLFHCVHFVHREITGSDLNAKGTRLPTPTFTERSTGGVHKVRAFCKQYGYLTEEGEVTDLGHRTYQQFLQLFN